MALFYELVKSVASLVAFLKLKAWKPKLLVYQVKKQKKQKQNSNGISRIYFGEKRKS